MTEGKKLGPIQVGVENGNVIVIFSEKLRVLGLPPKQARKFIKALKKHVIEAENMARDNET
jgi:hypothetical protein